MGWVVYATPRPLYPRERAGTHCTGGWVDFRAGLDGFVKSRPHRDSIPRTVHPVASRYTDWAIPGGRGGGSLQKVTWSASFVKIGSVNVILYCRDFIEYLPALFKSLSDLLESRLKRAAHMWVILLSVCECHENWRNEGSDFLMHVNDTIFKRVLQKCMTLCKYTRHAMYV